MALFSVMHEAGHGLYEGRPGPGPGPNPVGETALAGAARVPEPPLGELARARAPYLGHLLPRLRQRFPDQLGGVSLDQLERSANRVALADPDRGRRGHLQPAHPDPLRAGAGDLRRQAGAVELPAAWNARYRDYLGLDVPDDARGVLQDVHWSGRAFGYFPTYSLGNVIAGQLWEAAARVPDLDAQIAAGELAVLGEWLRDRVHRHGRRLSPAQILERAGAGALSRAAAGPPEGPGRQVAVASPGSRRRGRSWDTT